MKNKTAHLTEDQLIRLVVDSSDLSGGLRNHVSTCTHCQRLKKDLHQRLGRLAIVAKTQAPRPPQKIRLHSKTAFRPFRLAFAAGLALFLITIGIWQVMPSRKSNQRMLTQISTGIDETDFSQPFLADLNDLDENGLTDFYHTISGETSTYFDDEFIEFVHPVSDYSNPHLSKS